MFVGKIARLKTKCHQLPTSYSQFFIINESAHQRITELMSVLMLLVMLFVMFFDSGEILFGLHGLF